MIRFLRDLRLIPIAVVACTALLALKAADIMISGPGGEAPPDETSVVRTTPDVAQSKSALSWAAQMFNFPDGRGAAPTQIVMALPAGTNSGDITGAITETPAGGDAAAAKTNAEANAKPPQPAAPETKPAGTSIPLDNVAPPSGAERAILERLQQRREELDKRARELDIRESLIKAAEKRMEGELAELKQTEQRIVEETKQKNDAQAARFKSLVTMYENMKPRDAAKIFDRLETGVLLDVASKIEPRHMADIMAQMSPDSAERLTVELASKAQQGRLTSASPNDLPKIEGRPTTP